MKNKTISIMSAIIVSTLLTVSANADPVTLICKNFAFFMTVGGHLSYNGVTQQLQYTPISTPTGETRSTYAVYNYNIDQQFQGVAVAAGKRGEALSAGQCSLADRALPGINLDVRQNTPTISFSSFRNASILMGGKYSGSAVVRGSVPLPPCASGVLAFNAFQDSPNHFMVSGDAAVTCIP